jgi:membrane protein
MHRGGYGATGLPDALQIRDPQAWGGVKGKLFAVLQIGYQLISSFNAHQGSLRAAALTYTTVLSLVPFLAIAFAVLKGLGAQNALEPVLQQVAGDSEETIGRIIEYVNNTNFKSMGAIGLLALVLTVISLLGSIEEAFNSIWGVRETRSLQRRFSDYLSVVVVGPILLLAAMSMTSTLQSQWLVQWLIQRTYIGDTVLLLFRLLPYVIIWAVMFFLYIFIPNTRVRFWSALLGGILAGTAWQVAQWGYFHFQVGVAKYNAIYGTLAALPIFLVWVYTSWLIVLFGLEVVCAHQRRGDGGGAVLSIPLDAAAREELALALLMQIGRHFQKGGVPPGAACLADELGVSPGRTGCLLEELEELGYVARTAGNDHGWLPGREPSEIPVSEVLAMLRGDAEAVANAKPAMAQAGEVLRRSRDATRASLEGVTLHDLLVDGRAVKKQV